MKQILFFSTVVLTMVLAGCSGPKVIAPASISQKQLQKQYKQFSVLRVTFGK